MVQECDVLVVGGGPVGVLTALLLTRRGHHVIILEKEKAIVQSPRALVYHRQIIGTLEEAGVLLDMRHIGTTAKKGVQWRRASDHSLCAGVSLEALRPTDPAAGPHFAPILLGQNKFEEIVDNKLKETGCRTFRGYTYQKHEQVGNKVNVLATDSDGKEHEFSAPFVVGVDGAKSPIRHALGIGYEGFTHDVIMMAVNFKYDKIYATGFDEINFIMDPAEKVEDSNFSLIIYTGTDDVWRCAYGDGTQFSDEELHARVPQKLKKMLPLSPDPGQYELLQAQPYRIHQRCAPTYVKGRVLLAGDAAHANNPAGGLGLNSGLLDARILADQITKALKTTDEKEVARLLQEYSDIRRKGFQEFTNPASTENLRRLWEKNNEVEKSRNEFFEKMKDPEYQREMQLHANLMGYGVPGLDTAPALEHRELNGYHDKGWREEP